MSAVSGKVALITGGGRGLGAALCDSIAAWGGTVAVVDINEEAATRTAQSITGRGQKATACVADITDEQSVAALMENVTGREKQIDILINNAGVDVTLPIDELSVEAWDRVIATNLRGPFLLSKAVSAHMRRNGSGHIVNIASTAAKRAWANAAAYHASKWGLLGMSHALHAELRPHGIKVTAVVAGGMRTPFLLDRFPDIDPAVLQDPKDVAETIVAMLTARGTSVVPEVTILPMRESSWP